MAFSNRSDFTFDDLVKFARVDSPRVYYPPGPSNGYFIRKNATGVDIYLDSETYRDQLKTDPSAAVKVHINFGPKGSIPNGWNIIGPILMRYPQLTKSLKVVNPEVAAALNKGNIKVINQRIEAAKKIHKYLFFLPA